MQGHTGTSLGAISAISAIFGAAMAGLGAPWWAWVGFATWGVLWVTAALGLSDEASRKFLAGTLRKSTFTQIYTTLARRNVMGIWNRLCDPAPESASVPAFLRAAMTWRLYDVALRLAVAYPILLLVGQWVVTGAEGRVGSLVLLAVVDFWPHRALVILLVLILTGGAVGAKLASASQRPAVNMGGGWLLFLSILLALAISFAFAFAFTFKVALTVIVSVAVPCVVAAAIAVSGVVAIAIAFSLAFGVSLAFIVSGVFVLAVAFSCAFAIGLDASDRRGKQRFARVMVTAAVMGAVLIAAVSLDWAQVSDSSRSFFLFFAVLPLINALFDVVSYALTLSLIRRGLRSGLPFLWGLADLGLACGLLLGLGAVLVAVIHGLNLLAGVPFLDLPALFDGVQEEPGAYVWLYLMLFSTLLPTLLHGMLSLLGLQGIWPPGLRRPVAGWVAAAPASPLHALRASLSLSLIWALPLLGLGFVLWGIWRYAQPLLIDGLQLYLDGLLWIATHPVGAL